MRTAPSIESTTTGGVSSRTSERGRRRVVSSPTHGERGSDRRGNLRGIREGPPLKRLAAIPREGNLLSGGGISRGKKKSPTSGGKRQSKGAGE